MSRFNQHPAPKCPSFRFCPLIAHHCQFQLSHCSKIAYSSAKKLCNPFPEPRNGITMTLPSWKFICHPGFDLQCILAKWPSSLDLLPGYDIHKYFITRAITRQVIEAALPGEPVAEAKVAAGNGILAFGFKAGISTSSIINYPHSSPPLSKWLKRLSTTRYLQQRLDRE